MKEVETKNKIDNSKKILTILFFTFCFFGVFSFVDAVTVNTTNKDTLRNGLVGHWTMDGKDVVNGVLQDKSGNGNSGQLVNIATSTFYTLGKIGQALKFDGVDDYVNIPNSASLNSWTEQTISLWFKAQSGMVTYARLIEKGSNNEWSIVFNNVGNGSGGAGKLTIQNLGSTSGLISSTNVVTDNMWHKMDVTITSGNVVTLYIDGIQNSTATSPTNPVFRNGNINVGRYGSGGYNFKGSIDDVRIYNRALSASEVKQLYNLGAGGKINSTPKGVSTTGLNSGLVGWWTMDGKDVINGALQDKSGNGNTGTFVNIATSTFYTVGKIGQAGKFDGADDYVNATNAISAAGNSRGVCLWLNTSISSAVRQEVIGTRAGNSGWAINIGQGSVANTLTYYHAGIAVLSVSTTLNKGTWYHICANYDASSQIASLYKNGVYLNQSSMANDLASGINGKIGVGACTTGDCYFSGFLDDVRVYNRALSASEIQQLYNQSAGDKINSTPKGIPGTGLNSGLVGWWTMDGKDVVNGVLQDKSGNGNSGQLVNIATSTFYTLGKIGQAGKFDGVNDYIKPGNTSTFSFAPNNAFTLSSWVKLNKLPGSSLYGLIGKGTYGSNCEYHIYIGETASQVKFTISDGSANTAFIGRVTPSLGSSYVGTWHLFTAVYNGNGANSGISIYIDGVRSDTADYSMGTYTAMANLGASASVGSLNSGSNYRMNGSIDDVRYYNRVLSASEIKQLYNMGR